MTQTRAAALLGVTRGHLNMVLRGHRQSRSLLAKWQAMQQEELKRMSEQSNPRFSQDTAPTSEHPPSALDPSDANWDIRWHRTCRKLGFTIVLVKVPRSEQLWQNPGWEDRLGEELDAAHLGTFDSALWANPVFYFFLVSTKNMVAALNLIKARLAQIGLLPEVQIGVADQEAGDWRAFYPEPVKAGT